MKTLSIITEPNKNLRQKSEDILDIKNKELQELIPIMTKTMLVEDGIGLAAPQIGKNIRLIIIQTKGGPLACFNPVINKRSWRKEWGEEGCLSVPGVYGLVKRNYRVTVVYKNSDNQLVTIVAKGLLARVFQHEIDHLDGILFIDKAKDIHRANTL